jgi:hypothetical protein
MYGTMNIKFDEDRPYVASYKTDWCYEYIPWGMIEDELFYV